MVLDEPPVGPGDPVPQPDGGCPPERGDAAGVQQLARGPVGPAGVLDDVAVVPDDVGDDLGELPDGDVAPDPDVDGLRVVVVVEQVDDGGAEVVDVEELAAGGAGCPRGRPRGRRSGRPRRSGGSGPAGRGCAPGGSCRRGRRGSSAWRRSRAGRTACGPTARP